MHTELKLCIISALKTNTQIIFFSMFWLFTLTIHLTFHYLIQILSAQIIYLPQQIILSNIYLNDSYNYNQIPGNLDLTILFFFMINISNNILWAFIYANVYTPNILAYQPQHQHNIPPY